MTYFPEHIFKNILSYCDDRLERQHQKQTKKLVDDFDKIFQLKTEKGLSRKEWIIDGKRICLTSLFVPQPAINIMLKMNHILVTTCMSMLHGMSYNEVRTNITYTNPDQVINSYTKNAYTGTTPTYTYSECTNY